MSVEKANAEYVADSPFWAAELIVHLEGIRHGTALLWATDSVVGLLNEADPAYKEELFEWVRQLTGAADGASATSLMEKADAVWNRGEDAFHKSISHLFAAKAKLLIGDERFYRTHLVKALMFLGYDDNCRRTSAAVPFALFNKYANPE